MRPTIIYGPVVEWHTRSSQKRNFVGSNPTGATMKSEYARVVEWFTKNNRGFFTTVRNISLVYNMEIYYANMQKL